MAFTSVALPQSGRVSRIAVESRQADGRLLWGEEKGSRRKRPSPVRTRGLIFGGYKGVKARKKESGEEYNASRTREMEEKRG